jgi:hypothetical protein
MEKTISEPNDEYDNEGFDGFFDKDSEKTKIEGFLNSPIQINPTPKIRSGILIKVISEI